MRQKSSIICYLIVAANM